MVKRLVILIDINGEWPLFHKHVPDELYLQHKNAVSRLLQKVLRIELPNKNPGYQGNRDINKVIIFLNLIKAN